MAGSRPKRQRIGRGHGSGMVKTGGEGGKGQTVRSGGGKGPAFEGGQTPWARRLPHRRGYSQKARDRGHFGTRFAVVNCIGSQSGIPRSRSPRNRCARRGSSSRYAMASSSSALLKRCRPDCACVTSFFRKVLAKRSSPPAPPLKKRKVCHPDPLSS